MNRSESIKELALALHKAHAKISAVAKSASNPFFKSKYADLASVVDAVKPALHSEGIVFIQGLQDAEGGVAIETMLLHVSGEWISSTLRLPASKEDAQGYGSACTYGRRYGLQAICGLPAEDDDGNAATATAPKPTSVAGQEWERLDAEEKKFLQSIADQCRAKLEGEGPLEAKRYLEAQSLDAEEKVALWSRFDSKERSAMKKAA
jgi:hypothetical protein